MISDSAQRQQKGRNNGAKILLSQQPDLKKKKENEKTGRNHNCWCKFDGFLVFLVLKGHFNNFMTTRFISYEIGQKTTKVQ